MKSEIANWDLKDKTVLLRIDANVPIFHGQILNDQRLLASLPTMQLLRDKGARIIALTHLGRPKNKEKELSTKQLVSWFADNGYDVAFAANLEQVRQMKKADKELILLENLRFFPGEKRRDTAFAQTLAALGDYYVNDAFGALHRKDTSLTLLPKQFDQEHKTIGLLVEHELAMLKNIVTHPEKPFLLIIGGGKVADKIPLIEQLLPKVTTICIGPAIVFTFLKAQGKQVGKSLIDEQAIDLCTSIMLQAEQYNVNVHYPLDYIVAEGSFEGPLDETLNDHISDHDVGVSIGQKTAHQWSEDILKAKTIVFNGLMGSIRRPETLTYVQQLFQAMSNADATSIIAGGDSVAAAHLLGFAQGMTYLSTGGGATLQYLGGKQLPALSALKNRTEAEQMQPT